MNHAHAIQTVSATWTAKVSTVARFQIYQQTREGIYASAFMTDSAVEAVVAFLRQTPAFEGGELRLWDHRENRLSASVKWNLQKTESDAPAPVRENVYNDRMLALLARLIQPQEKLRETIQQGVRMGA